MTDTMWLIIAKSYYYQSILGRGLRRGLRPPYGAVGVAPPNGAGVASLRWGLCWGLRPPTALASLRSAGGCAGGCAPLRRWRRFAPLGVVPGVVLGVAPPYGAANER
ncbi:hypothetical protein EBV26_09890 [bacterium]|nr:hypothetical protein [bacterium]